MLLSPSDFFVRLRKALKHSLPAAMHDFRTIRGRGRLMKVHFGEPAFHYEAWHHAGVGRLEVGLHFEASAGENQAAFDFFRSRMVEVKASLPRGPSSSHGIAAGPGCTRPCRPGGWMTSCSTTRSPA